MKATHKDWDNYSVTISQELNQSNNSNFLKQSKISASVHPSSGYAATMFDHFKNQFTIEQYKDIPRDLLIGSPNICKDGLSLTTIQQYFHHTLIENYIGKSLSKLDFFTDLGGGYGRGAQLMLLRGFSGYAQIVDLPVMNSLQGRYLSQTFENGKINLNTQNTASVPTGESLIHSSYAWEEMQPEVRNSYETLVSSHKYIIIVHDNRDKVEEVQQFFKEYASRLSNTHEVEHIDHPAHKARKILMAKRITN